MSNDAIKTFRLHTKRFQSLLEDETPVDWCNLSLCSVDEEHIMAEVPLDIHKIFNVERFAFEENERMIWSWLGDCIVRDDLVAEMEEQGFTGFQTYGVTIHNQLGHRIDDRRFFRLAITGWGGCARPESGIQLREKCPGCNRQTYSMYKDPQYLFDHKQWDGSDFFLIWPLPKYIFITERVANYFKQLRLKDYCLTELDKLPVTDLWDDLSPGRLLQYLPAELAIKYGQKDGII